MTNPLLEAVKRGDVEQVRALVADDPAAIRAAATSLILLSIYMRKPDVTAVLLAHVDELTLHEAAAVGDRARVAAIVAAAPDRVDEPGRDGFTPLGLAAYFGHADVAAVLLRHGADVNLPSQNTQHVAPLHSAVSARHGAVIELLLAHGADVNVAQNGGITPLMQAAHHGDAALVRRLLDHGADAAAETAEGRDALWYAEDVEAEGVVDLLRQQGSR